MRFPVLSGVEPRAARFERVRRIISLLAVACLLQGCSVMKIAYNQVAELAYWQLDGYFDFNDAQTLRVREELANVHQWHRQTQLPAYIETLKKWQTWMPGELDETQACSMFSEVRSKLLLVSDRSELSAVALVGSMVPEQIDHLKRKFSKLNKEYRSDFIDGTAQSLLDKRFKKAVSRAEMLYGTLEDKQLAVIRTRIAQSVFNASLSLAEHQRRQQDAVQTLTPLMAGQATPNQAKSAIRGYFDRSLNSPNATYRNYQDKLIKDNCRTFAELHNSTTAAQRDKAVQTLRMYEEDFKILAARRS